MKYMRTKKRLKNFSNRGDEPAKDSAAKDIRNDSTRIAVNGKAAAVQQLAAEEFHAGFRHTYI